MIEYKWLIDSTKKDDISIETYMINTDGDISYTTKVSFVRPISTDLNVFEITVSGYEDLHSMAQAMIRAASIDKSGYLAPDRTEFISRYMRKYL